MLVYMLLETSLTSVCLRAMRALDATSLNQTFENLFWDLDVARGKKSVGFLCIETVLLSQGDYDLTHRVHTHLLDRGFKLLDHRDVAGLELLGCWFWGA